MCLLKVELLSDDEVIMDFLTQSDTSFTNDIQQLIDRDRDLARIVEVYGYPDPWRRKPGFATLIRIILEQQVSYASAQAAFKRLQATVATLTPVSFLTLDDDKLRAIGFSRQKTRYGRILAQTIIDGDLNLVELSHLDDLEIRQRLTAIKGIGDWTVDIFIS
ncbi:MAG: hypothetical protein AAFQ41_15085 [Cyanobacteria bacterium J06623_7]